MAYQILVFIIIGLVFMCFGFNEDKGSALRASIVSLAVGWIICSILFQIVRAIVISHQSSGGLIG